MYKVAVIGNGYLGRQIAAMFEVEPIQQRIESYGDALMAISEASGADVIINAVGATGSPNVDSLEKPLERYPAFVANVMVPLWLAQALDKNTRLVHISSGCIFDGNEKVFDESDAPNFEGSYYSFTKKTAERALEHFKNVLILRIRMPISGDRGPRNLISKLLKYDTIIETPNSVTTVREFMKALKLLIEQEQVGIWNIVAPTPVTHKEILEMYDEIMGTKIVASKKFIKAEDLDTAAPRTNVVLSSAKLYKLLRERSTREQILDELRDIKNEEDALIQLKQTATKISSLLDG